MYVDLHLSDAVGGVLIALASLIDAPGASLLDGVRTKAAACRTSWLQSGNIIVLLTLITNTSGLGLD